MSGTNLLYNRLVFVLSVIGALVAGFLWYLHAAHVDIPCGLSNDCATVAASRYSRFPEGNGFFVAAWGTIGYIGFAALAYARTLTESAKRDRILLGLLVLGAVAGTLFSLRLTYLELYVIHALCKWCVASQVIIAAVAAIAIADWFAPRPAPLSEVA
ncbi:MAG: vitamin K epoxide reductase family protein [Armatimonadetes bacterium]|nr:vitamin K epoxide reductase family protein [Armatimonadota bacterium]